MIITTLITKIFASRFKKTPIAPKPLPSSAVSSLTNLLGHILRESDAHKVAQYRTAYGKILDYYGSSGDYNLQHIAGYRMAIFNITPLLPPEQKSSPAQSRYPRLVYSDRSNLDEP